MPLELALLPVVESAFNPVAYSRARASGLWQFIPATGRRYGLKQNWYYDGRRDVVAATTAALDYLEFLAAEFDGDWLLAVAAYNSGEANVASRGRNAIAPPASPPTSSASSCRAKRAPTCRSCWRCAASSRDPTSHGLAFAPIPNQPYFAKVDVGGQIDLHVAAELADLPKEELLALNPAFNHWVTDPDGPHHLLVPIDRAGTLRRRRSLPCRPKKRVRVVYHRVRRGDTLGGIADKYGVSVAALSPGEQDPRHRDSSGPGSADRRGTARHGCPGRCADDCRSARGNERPTQQLGQARRAPRRHAVEHRSHARREHG